MSSVPPNMPPGGAPPPYPPYDPKTQWRVYQEQQKAAWRAQRDAWKAQRYAAKAVYGPRVPSVVGPIILITIGIVAMLIATGHINGEQFWNWYDHWWPLVLIGAGLALLAEWALDLKRTTPVHRGSKYIGILVILVIVGFVHNGWNHWGPESWNWNGNDGDFFNSFGLPQHDLDQPVLTAQIPANAAIDIENSRGDVSVEAGEGSTIEVHAHEVAFASSDEAAKKIFDAETTALRVSGNAVVVKPNESSSGRVNLTITVPKAAWVTINSGKGDVAAAGLGAGLHISARGDVRLSDIKGSTDVRFSDGNHNFSAHQIEGDLSADGHCDDVTLSEIKGKVSLNGDFFGETHIENVSGPVHLHTSVTLLSTPTTCASIRPRDRCAPRLTPRTSTSARSTAMFPFRIATAASASSPPATTPSTPKTPRGMWKYRSRPTPRPRSTPAPTTATSSPTTPFPPPRAKTKRSLSPSVLAARASS